MTIDWGLTSVALTAQLPVDQLAMARRLPPTRQLSLHGTERAALTSYLQEHIKASDQDGRPLAVEVRQLSTAEVDGLTHLQAHVQLQASTVLSTLRLDYDVILHRVASHKILLFKGHDISEPQATAASTSGPGPGALQTTLRYQHTTAELDGGSQRVLRTGWAFLQLGAEHIAAGSDHLLFSAVTVVARAVLCSAMGLGGAARPCGHHPSRCGHRDWVYLGPLVYASFRSAWSAAAT